MPPGHRLSWSANGKFIELVRVEVEVGTGMEAKEMEVKRGEVREVEVTRKRESVTRFGDWKDEGEEDSDGFEIGKWIG